MAKNFKLKSGDTMGVNQYTPGGYMDINYNNKLLLVTGTAQLKTEFQEALQEKDMPKVISMVHGIAQKKNFENPRSGFHKYYIVLKPVADATDSLTITLPE